MAEGRVSPRSRFFHGYYDSYCYLPLYVFCGRHLLAAKLRPANIDAAAGATEEIARLVGQIRARWPKVRILLRVDSGFCRDAPMTWAEENQVDYLFGLARNARLVDQITAELQAARAEAEATGKPARRFKDFHWRTRESWSRERRAIGKAEWTQGEANPRFIVTSLAPAEAVVTMASEHFYVESLAIIGACVRKQRRFLLGLADNGAGVVLGPMLGRGREPPIAALHAAVPL